jgi:copper(I)-binding protein
MRHYKHILTLAAVFMLAISTQVTASGVMADEAYVRAVPPGQTNSAAFMTLHNHSTEAKRLMTVESSVADSVELHGHQHENGMMKMRQVKGGIEIAPHGMTKMEPGGLHIMLIGLKQKLVPGESVHLRLKFDDNSTQDVHAEIRKLAMTMKKGNKMKMDHSMH